MDNDFNDSLGGLHSQGFSEARRLIGNEEPEKARSLCYAFAMMAPLTTAGGFDWVAAITPFGVHYQRHPLQSGDKDFLGALESLRLRFRSGN